MKNTETTAFAANTAGTASPEGLSRALLSLKKHLLSPRSSFIPENAESLILGATPEDVYVKYSWASRLAYVLVEDGHVHVGLVGPEFLPLFEPRLLDTKEVGVVYASGGTEITTPHSPAPLISIDDSMTAWDFSSEHPAKIRRFSLHVLRDGQLVEISTRPAKGYYCEENY
jgi:hypothetical protein